MIFGCISKSKLSVAACLVAMVWFTMCVCVCERERERWNGARETGVGSVGLGEEGGDMKFIVNTHTTGLSIL